MYLFWVLLMKKLAGFAFTIIFFSWVAHVATYATIERPDRIIQRAFTIGGWDACKNGASLSETYMSHLSYMLVRLRANWSADNLNARPYMQMALDVSKCKSDTMYHSVDNARVKRGIKFALAQGEDINQMFSNGLRPLHVAATLGNLELITYLMKQGAEPSLKSSENSRSARGAYTPLELIQENKKIIGIEASEDVIRLLSIKNVNGY